MSPRRMTRAEQREHTRTCLISAAAKVFSRCGYEKASLDQVAEEAGFTKGAVYSNFKGKEDLFLATVDAHMEERLDAVRRVLESDQEEGKAHAAGMDFMDRLNADPEYFALFFEFWGYAQRNPPVRRKFLPRVQRFRASLAEMFDDMPTPMPSEELASMLIAMATGVAMERSLDPDSVPDDMYARMLKFFFEGLMSGAGTGAAAALAAGEA